MTVYLLHFAKPYGPKRVQHYLGATKFHLAERMKRHETERGAALVRAVLAAGIAVRVVRVWKVATKDDAFKLEIRLKSWRRHKRYCLYCSGRRAKMG